MNSSQTIGKISAALAKAQGMFQPAVFNRQNPHFKSKYADLAALFEATREGLAVNELAVVQLVVDSPPNTVCVESCLLHSSGEWIISSVTMPADRATPQGWGASITYAKRYGFSALLCIAGEDDDDGNAATAAVAQRAVPTPKSSPQGTAAPRPVPPSPQESESPAGKPSGGDSFESLKSDLESTPKGEAGRDTRLAISKRVITAQKAGVLTLGQVAELRRIYEVMEKGDAVGQAGTT